MVRTKDGDGIKSNLIVAEVQKRPCLFDTNHPHYGDRSEKARSWEEVCGNIVPGWSALSAADKFAAGKDIQKRWRSIRDSFTKAYRQGKCILPEHCAPNSRRYLYHKQMSFLLRALQNKKPRYSLDKCETLSEVSSSPQHSMPTIDDYLPKIRVDAPLDLKTRAEPEKATVDKANQSNLVEMTSVELKIDGNSILPGDHFDDDRLFMNSLLPLFKKMDDDTRLLCRIEVLKIIRFALQNHKSFEDLRSAEDSFFKTSLSGILAKQEPMSTPKDSTLSMTTRSADGSRPVRKRKIRSPSPAQTVPKKRGPGRPRKIRPRSDEEEEAPKKRSPAKVEKPPPYVEPRLTELEEKLKKATSAAHLETPLFMKVYNLERAKSPNVTSTQIQSVTIKTEPLDSVEPPNVN